MSVRTRTTLAAAAATLLTAMALIPLTEDGTWYTRAVIAVALLAGVGAAARRFSAPRPTVVAVELVAAVALLSFFFAREQAVAWLLPGPGAVARLAALARQGLVDVTEYANPAPLTDGIGLLLVGGVLLIAVLVDTLAVTYALAAPAGLPLLALYSVAAGLAEEGGAGAFAFGAAAVGYLVLLLADGRERLTRWGRTFGGAGAASRGGGQRTGRRIGAAALGVALLAPAALPSLGTSLVGGLGSGSGTGTGGRGNGNSVDLLVALRDNLNDSDDRTVLTVRTTSRRAGDMYLRIVSLDEFDGTTWKASPRRTVLLPPRFPDPPGLGAQVRRKEVTSRITAADWYEQRHLPMPYPATWAEALGRWRLDPLNLTVSADAGATTEGETWEVSSLEVLPTREQLASAPAPGPELRNFTDLPSTLPDEVGETARAVTEDAGNAYEQAVALQDWFSVTGGFTYDTEVELGEDPDAIARFLEARQGFCVHFSFAMAAMARSLGIPARVAVGFAPGAERGDGSMEVNLRDAHAWPELYFEGVGWTRFEPTPTRGTVPDYTRPETTPGGATPTPSAAAEDDELTAPKPKPSSSESCTPERRRLDACPDEDEPAAAAGGGGPRWPQVLLWSLVALVVVLAPLSPMLWRTRVRRRRLGPPSRGGADVAPHTLRLWREVTDTAWDLGTVPDDSLTPRRAAERIARVGGLDGPRTDAVHRVATAVERVLYAPRAEAVPGTAADARAVVEALRAAATGPARLRATLAPRSAARAVARLRRRVSGVWASGAWTSKAWRSRLAKRTG
ncbi:transglutaminase TgpA family protein [Streptomyces fragilis]|uniref:TransglutaminaseTgpA domain-containing protein n=1 Tax=Streptomyces fragilis TaxID=67301 RepID=A0ABV2YBP2_9ACTN|nr:transglutaminaseTgpA domain-containing protein [Streptomyces fragilis]